MELLFAAEKAGIISSHERRQTVLLWDEKDIYMENPSIKAREGFMMREAVVDEVMDRVKRGVKSLEKK